MEKNKMLIDATHPEETRVVVLRGGRVEEFDFESAARKLLRGNIYLAKVTRVEPSLQAAFIEYGGNRHGFLAFSEIHPDYYQIPVADRQALLDEEARAEAEAEAQADARAEARARRSGRRPNDRDQGGGHGSLEPLPLGDDEAPVQAHDDSEPHAEPHDGEPVASIALASDEGPALKGPSIEVERAAGDVQHDAAESRPAPTEHEDRSLAEAGYAPGERSEPAAHDESPMAIADDAESEAPVADAELTDVPEPRGLVEDVGVEEVPAPETIENGQAIEVEQVGSEDAMEEVPERPRRRPRTYKIQEVIKRRQIILVQVVKEERGNKGAALTTYLSLAGRYTVLMPNTNRGGGISRKITQPQDRKRLKAIAEELDVPEGMGLIIRTAGAARTKQEIKRDFEYLLRLWESVRELTLSSTAPSLVYEEGDLIKRSIRDLYTKDIDDIVVAGEAAHREAQDFMRMLMPSHAGNVHNYREPEPLFARYQIERQLNAMFSPYVTLRSGGYIVINQTEALVSIDVNSGKSTREFSIEETALNTNLEASEEIARQLKLRDLAGLIVIDFIDMEERRNNRRVENRLKDALRHDRARIQVGRISHFGLLEMSRQRLRTGVVEGSTSQCPHCQGTGTIRSTESVALAVLRGLEDALLKDDRSGATAVTTALVALYILNHKRSFIVEMERRYGVPVLVEASDRMQGANYTIERTAVQAAPQRRPERSAVSPDWGFDDEDAAEPVEAGYAAEAEDDRGADHEHAHHGHDGGRSRGHDRGQRHRPRHAEGEPVRESEAGLGEGQRSSRRRRRRRGRRGESGDFERHDRGQEGRADQLASDEGYGPGEGEALVSDHAVEGHETFAAAQGHEGAADYVPHDHVYQPSGTDGEPEQAGEIEGQPAAGGDERQGDRGGRRSRRRGRRGGRRGRGEQAFAGAEGEGAAPGAEDAGDEGDMPEATVDMGTGVEPVLTAGEPGPGEAHRTLEPAPLIHDPSSEPQPVVEAWPIQAHRDRPAREPRGFGREGRGQWRRQSEPVPVVGDEAAEPGVPAGEPQAARDAGPFPIRERHAEAVERAPETVPMEPATVSVVRDAEPVATPAAVEQAVQENATVEVQPEPAAAPAATPVPPPEIVVVSTGEEAAVRPARRGWWRSSSTGA